MATFRERLRHFGENTTLHGLKYVLDDKRPTSARLVWTAIFVSSLYGMIRLFQSSYKSHKENAISFVTETAYLNWNTSFPAITLCEITGSELTWDTGTDDADAVHQFISDVIFFTGSCYSCNLHCPTCAQLNFTQIVKRFRKKCPQLLSHCQWNSIKFDCCEQFLPLETEYGVCFSINSLHTAKTGTKMDLFSNMHTGPGALLIATVEDVRLYFHAREDVPFINSDPDQRKDVMLGETYNISINIIEIENDENVISLPIEQRACRFPEEKPPDLIIHNLYSYSTCVVQCHAKAHVELCNCTHHLMPVLGVEKQCNIDGLKCLTDNFETVNRLHAKGFDKSGLVCDCLPSCVEPEFKVVADINGVKSSHSEIFVEMQALPTFRFKRIVVRTAMDLVVSIGGTAGLFIGASLLSVVEFIYLGLLRRNVN